jgi:2'-5' RNA ligase
VSVHQPIIDSGLLVKHRYFVALMPAPETLTAIRRCGLDAGLAKANAADRFHLTLFVTDDFETEPNGLADRMRAALDRVRADSFDIALARYGHHGGSLLPGPCRPLRVLQGHVARLLKAGGVAERADRGAFSPHVTLGYGGASPAFACSTIEPIRWRALDFVLIHSLLRLTTHREIGRWPLIDQPRLL